jgi:P-type E1-E2 ATPase
MTSARELVPLTTLPDARPRAPSQPCEACGALLDPLRAHTVLGFDDGYRYLCGAQCEADFRKGARQRRAPTPITERSVTTPIFSPRTPSGRAIPLATPPLEQERAGRGLWVGVASVLLAAILGLFAERPPLALLSALGSSFAAIAALSVSLPVLRSSGTMAWGIGPLGSVLAALSAYQAVATGTGSWLGLQGAALAAAAMLARAWLDQNARAPLDAACHQLVQRLPARVHIPVASATDPLAMSMQLAEASVIRTGEEIVAMRGETLAVDGVVQAGEAQILPYPGATTPLRRRMGDSLLAGSTVVEGALRVLVTRAGPERSLVRLASFGHGKERGPALLSRVSASVTRFGAAAAIGLASAVVLLQTAGGPGALSCAAAVLIAAPLLSLRRAAQAPLRAAAAAAGTRGIVFSSEDALDTTGRATLVALSPYGVLTEARPVVVELNTLDDSKPDELIAIAAAAERIAQEHPIALAVERFARERRLPELEVRRPVHHVGKGVTAISPQGQPLVVGSRRLLLEEGISVAAADAAAARAEASERAPLFIAVDGRVRAIMTLHYELRVGARPAIQRMYDLGLEVVLLTGEQRGAVQALAAALDVEHVKAELLPEERGHEVRSLHDAGSTVAALGRPGVDDAALAAADAGIVLGAAGGATAERAVALVSDDVRDAAAALWIARATRDGALRAVFAAVAAFGLVVVAAAAGLMVPGIAALLTLAVDAYSLPAGARLMHRIALRLPSRS